MLETKKIHKAINYQFIKRLNIVAKDLYELELVKPTKEHREPIIIGFFILHYAKLRTLELFYDFFDKFLDVYKIEELEMDTNFCSLAFGIDDYILPSKRAEWTEKRSKDCRDDFREDAKNNFSPILAALNLRNMTRENHNYSRRKSELSKCHAC